jgi:hypothetical protein
MLQPLRSKTAAAANDTRRGTLHAYARRMQQRANVVGAIDTHDVEIT